MYPAYVQRQFQVHTPEQPPSHISIWRRTPAPPLDRINHLPALHKTRLSQLATSKTNLTTPHLCNPPHTSGNGPMEHRAPAKLEISNGQPLARLVPTPPSL